MAKKSGHWKDIGPWLHQVLGLKDWVKQRKVFILPPLKPFRFISFPSQKFGGPTVCSCFHTQKCHVPFLSHIADSLWAKDSFDTGEIKNAAPVNVEPKSDFRSYRAQYRMSSEAEQELSEINDSLLQKGAISQCVHIHLYLALCSP